MDGFTLASMEPRVIHLHPAAPAKPAIGAACNGCGVCCATEPCPIGMLASLRTSGACRLLQWSGSEGRYLCGAVGRGPGWWRGLARRWIAADRGCDASLNVQGRAAE